MSLMLISREPCMPNTEQPDGTRPPAKPPGVILRTRLPVLRIEGRVVKIMPARLVLRDAESIDRAHDDLTRGRTAYAKHVLPSLLKRYPLDFDVIEAQARVYEAEEDYEHAIALVGENITAFFTFLRKTTGSRDGFLIPYACKENKPFIGCLFKLCLYAWYTLQDSLAMEHFKTLLELDPSDPKGARYFILHLAINLERFDEAAVLANKIGRDELQGFFQGGGNRELFGMLYGLGLLVFVVGDLPGAVTLLEFAIKSNPHAMASLLVDARFNSAAIDQVVAQHGHPAGITEGRGYVDDWADVWDKYPGSLEFLLFTAKKVIGQPGASVNEKYQGRDIAKEP